jgi:hypothetical protein
MTPEELDALIAVLSRYGNGGRGSTHPQSVACRHAREAITVMRMERDRLAAEVAELRAIITLMDAYAPRADSTCREPGITFSEACRREWKDRMGGDDA